MTTISQEPCTLTGFKGDFNATMSSRKDGNVDIQSQCGKISIIVYGPLASRKLAESWPQKPEFFYS
jgi:hypothetical protein